MPKPPSKSSSEAKSSSEPSVPPSPAVPSRPKLIFPLGRGSHGKTFWTRWAIERAQDEGRQVVVADADRTNSTLSEYFGDEVKQPYGARDAEMADWFATFSEELIERKLTGILDLGGGGDLLLKKLHLDYSVTSLFEDNGVQPVAVHFLGPDLDDLAYLNDLEKEREDGRVFAPNAIILVLNEALLPPERTTKAFDLVMNNEVFKTAVDRGAKPILMPRLVPAHEIDTRRLTFAAAEKGKVKEGQTRIRLAEQQMIRKWRRTMEENFHSVAELLP